MMSLDWIFTPLAVATVVIELGAPLVLVLSRLRVRRRRAPCEDSHGARASDFSAAPKGQNRPDRTQGRTSDGHRSFNQTHVVAKGAPYDKHEESEAEQGRRCRLCPRARSYDNGDDRPGQHQSDHQWHTDNHDDDHRREWGTREQPHRRGTGLPSLHDPMLPGSVPGRADATPHLIGCRTRLAGDCDTPCVSNRTLIADVETVASAATAPDSISFTVRSSATSDLEQLASLYARAYPTGDAVASYDEAVADIAASLEGAYGVYLHAASPVIVHRGELVAAVMTVNRTPWEGDPSCPFIIEAFTAPEHRRAGLATTLLVTAATAVSAHDRSIALRVDDTNTDAIRLYEKLGFREWPDAPTT